MKDLVEIIGKLIAVLYFRKVISNGDKEYILGHISEEEWAKEEVNDKDGESGSGS